MLDVCISYCSCDISSEDTGSSRLIIFDDAAALGTTTILPVEFIWTGRAELGNDYCDVLLASII